MTTIVPASAARNRLPVDITAFATPPDGAQSRGQRAAQHHEALDSASLGYHATRGPSLARRAAAHFLKRTWKWSLWPFQWRMMPKPRPLPRGYWNSSSSVLSLTFCLRACS